MYNFFAVSDIYEDYSSRHFFCTDDIDIKNEVLLFDRTTMDSPVVLMETGIIKYDYSKLSSRVIRAFQVSLCLRIRQCVKHGMKNAPFEKFILIFCTIRIIKKIEKSFHFIFG